MTDQVSDRFLDELDLTAVLPRGWKMKSRLRYKTNIGPARIIQVPKGFPTDLASIPRVFRPLVTKDGPSRYAAVVHDYLYSLKGEGPKGVPRDEADTIFREAMLDMGVSRWKMVLMHRAVVSFGWILFNRKRK